MLALLVRLAPYLGAGLVSALIGFNTSGLIPFSSRVYLLGIFLVLLLSLIILDREPGWNLALYLVVALCAGILLAWSGAALGQTRTWITFLVLIVLILTVGMLMRRGIPGAWILVYPVALAYIIGWVFFFSGGIPAGFRKGWIGFGLVLFSALAVMILVRGRSKDQGRDENTISLASELFLVLFNLCWLSGLVWLS